jgi:hypothetical protein
MIILINVKLLFIFQNPHHECVVVTSKMKWYHLLLQNMPTYILCTTSVMEMLELHQRNIIVSIQIASQTTDVYATLRSQSYGGRHTVQNEEEVVDATHANPLTSPPQPT